ncbi:hypothetical protein [Buttiauxella sp.]|uniref:hypothetical protein n=1 Tax=Buttiauxella sp. TaxID=1972222 RepID=UPI003C707DC0
MKTKQSKPTGRQLIEAYIRKHDGCTHTEIREALNLSTTTVGSGLALLKRERLIESRGINGQMRYHLLATATESNQPIFGLSPNMALLNRLLAEVRA